MMPLIPAVCFGVKVVWKKNITVLLQQNKTGIKVLNMYTICLQHSSFEHIFNL